MQIEDTIKAISDSYEMVFAHKKLDVSVIFLLNVQKEIVNQFVYF